jgi:NADH-ubiquinone oxidoreductase chain 2
VAEGCEWFSYFILSTLQKIRPLVLIFYNLSNLIRGVLYRRALLRGAMGRIGAINEISLRKILAFSSVHHLGWVLLPLAEGRRV